MPRLQLYWTEIISTILDNKIRYNIHILPIILSHRIIIELFFYFFQLHWEKSIVAAHMEFIIGHSGFLIHVIFTYNLFFKVSFVLIPVSLVMFHVFARLFDIPCVGSVWVHVQCLPPVTICPFILFTRFLCLRNRHECTPTLQILVIFCIHDVYMRGRH
jgi:hypothetical protein